MFRRSCAALLFVFAVTACGGAASEQAASPTGVEKSAAVLVTTDCGAKVVTEKSPVVAGDTAMRALDKVAEIETDSAGKFVTAIEGVQQDEGKKLAWLYYVNGKAAEKGAAEVKLQPGDVEWWDLHNWEKECASVPADAQ